MAHLATGSVIRQIESLFEGSSVAGLTDRQLLERFTHPTRCRCGSGLRRSGRPARADGPGRVPPDPGRPAPCRGCLSSRLPRLGLQGSLDPKPRPGGNWLYGVALRTARKVKTRLSRRRKNEEGDAMSDPGGRDGSSRRSRRPTCRQSPASKPRSFTARLPACQSRSGCRSSSATSRASASTRPRSGLDGPAGTLRSRLARATTSSAAASPAAASSCPPPRWPADWSHSIRLGVGLIPSVRHHDPGRDPIRGWTGRLALGGGPCPGGAPIHAPPQAEIDRDDLVAHRRRRHRRGVSHARAGEAG